MVPNSLSPQWEETFEFAVKEHSRRLELTVMDSDLVVDEIVGFLPIRLEDLLHKKRVSATRDVPFFANLSVEPVQMKFEVFCDIGNEAAPTWRGGGASLSL